MDPARLDAWSRRLGAGLSRRRLSTAFSGFLVAAGLTPAATTLAAAPITAQACLADGKPCTSKRKRKRNGKGKPCRKCCSGASKGRGKRERCTCRKTGSDCTNAATCCSQWCPYGVCQPKCGEGGPCRVFVTSTRLTGSMGGGNVADFQCHLTAAAAELGGVGWKAWLSTSDSSPATSNWLLDAPYVLLDGTLIASSRADLLDGGIAHPINQTEARQQTADSHVWTGTLPNGTTNNLTARCLDWINSGDETFGRYGQINFPSNSPNNWTDADFQSCANELPIYCFETA